MYPAKTVYQSDAMCHCRRVLSHDSFGPKLPVILTLSDLTSGCSLCFSSNLSLICFMLVQFVLIFYMHLLHT
jgi:hypothetical protein